MLIGLIGGPGSGKSTTAADVFAKCKSNGLTAELIQEYARDQINIGWRPKSAGDQFRILLEQRRKEDIIPDKVYAKITDSPTILSLFYALMYCEFEDVCDRENIVALYREFLIDLRRYDMIFSIHRVKPYVDDGTRGQTEEESNKITTDFEALLDIHHVPYTIVNGDDSGVNEIFEYIMVQKLDEAIDNINSCHLKLGNCPECNIGDLSYYGAAHRFDIYKCNICEYEEKRE